MERHLGLTTKQEFFLDDSCALKDEIFRFCFLPEAKIGGSTLNLHYLIKKNFSVFSIGLQHLHSIQYL